MKICKYSGAQAPEFFLVKKMRSLLIAFKLSKLPSRSQLLIVTDFTAASYPPLSLTSSQLFTDFAYSEKQIKVFWSPYNCNLLAQLEKVRKKLQSCIHFWWSCFEMMPCLGILYRLKIFLFQVIKANMPLGIGSSSEKQEKKKRPDGFDCKYLFLPT